MIGVYDTQHTQHTHDTQGVKMIIKNEKLQEQILHVEQGLAAVKQLMNDAELMSWFADDFALRFCWSSNAIEGNTLSLDETIALVEFDEVSAGHTYSEYQDAKNLYSAICTSMIPFHSEPITEAWIKENNGLLRGAPGAYRTGDVRVGTLVETSHMPPHHDRVPALMQDFMADVNIQNDNLAELFKQITLSHIIFERIHPFQDGNGRVGRMVLNQQLINNGLLPIALTKNSNYIQSFGVYNKNKDYSKMMYEILKAEIEAIEHLKTIEQKRHHGLDWDPKMTLEAKIEAASRLQAEQSGLAQRNGKEDKDER